MKKLFLFIALLVGAFQARADEGMWLLQMIQEQHLIDSLRKAGLQMPVSELYSEQHPSLREVVGIFGGGCTGEIISKDGLILTNNHCGFESVHAMSTMDKNYLQDGFFAKSRAEEVPVPELTFKFIVRIEDVTTAIQTYARREKINLAVLTDDEVLERIGYKWLMDTEYANRPGMDARLYSFYSGNRYYMVYTQEFSDIRLVVNPPQNVAQFGGNSDNWVWPRHNPDFAIFRIYADENGNPAEYSATNKPLKCRQALPISLAGVSEGSYAMIMGFPGQTQRNLTAGQLSFLKNDYYPAIILPFKLKMEHLWKRMQADKAENLALANDYFDLGNASKKFEGETVVIDRERLIEKAHARATQLKTWAQKNNCPEYVHVAERLDSVYRVYGDSIHDVMLAGQAIRALNGLFRVAEEAQDYILSEEETANIAENVLPKAEVKNSHALVKDMIRLYYKEKRLPFNVFDFGSEKEALSFVDALYTKSVFTDSVRMQKMLKKKDQKAYDNDPVFRLKEVKEKYLSFIEAYINFGLTKGDLEATFVRALCEMNEWSKAPDANSTLRLTYGHVADLHNLEGQKYGYETTLDGMIAKEDAKNPDYVLHPRMRELYDAKNYGRYARKDGKLPACFITTNDITGGNSGSPVLNAKGQLIGCAFDGNLEGLGSDLEYDIKLQRTIVADIRFILWVTEIFGGSRYVIDELNIVQ